MVIPEKYKYLIGQNGFPVAANGNKIIDLAIEIGNYVAKNQGPIVEGYKIPLLARPSTMVGTNKKFAQTVLPERAAFEILQGMVKDFGPMSGFRNIGFIAEENEYEAGVHEAYWTIDPICRIKNYINGDREWSLSIGFAVAGQPTGGVIYSPVKTEVLYTGDDGQSYRRVLGGQDNEPTQITKISHDLDLLRRSDRQTLVANFAKQATGPFAFYNPDVLSNVPLQAITSRVANQDYVVEPDLPALIAAPK